MCRHEPNNEGIFTAFTITRCILNFKNMSWNSQGLKIFTDLTGEWEEDQNNTVFLKERQMEPLKEFSGRLTDLTV